MADELEIRHLDGLRADISGATPKLVGTAIVFNEISRDLGGFVERIAPGAVQYDDLVALHNHDTSRILGRVTARTLRVTGDARGLHFEVDLPKSAADLVESVQRGDATGVSFAFSHAKDSWNTSVTPPVRTIHEMRVREISLGVPPPFAAYSQPRVSVALRSLESARSAAPPPLEVPVPEIIVPPVPIPDPAPPVPPVVSTRADHGDDVEVRVLKPGDSFRSWVEERTTSPKEYAHLRLGDCLRALVTGPRNELERRALSEGTDSAGGFSVPDILLAQWIDRLRNALTVVRAGAVTVPLTSDVTKIARLLTDPVAAWRSENAAVAESDPTFEAVTFAPKSLDVFTKVSRELLEDSVNIAEMLEASLVRSFAVEVDRVCLYGSGTPPQPRGLRTTTSVKEVSMGTNGLALANYDPILDLLALVWAANVTEGRTAIMAPRTLAAISKLKEATTNAPLARPTVLADYTFLMSSNVPINETQGSSSLASSLFLGDWSQMMLGFRTQMQVEVARELFRGSYQYGFFGHLRMDMQVTHPESFGRVIGIL